MLIALTKCPTNLVVCFSFHMPLWPHSFHVALFEASHCLDLWMKWRKATIRGPDCSTWLALPLCKRIRKMCVTVTIRDIIDISKAMISSKLPLEEKIQHLWGPSGHNNCRRNTWANQQITYIITNTFYRSVSQEQSTIASSQRRSTASNQREEANTWYVRHVHHLIIYIIIYSI